MRPGIYTDLSKGEYLAAPGLSSSKVRDLLDLTPLAAWTKWQRPQERTDALDFGTAAHQWLLEGDRWLDGFYVLPKGHDGRGGDGRKLLNEVKAAGFRPLKWEAHKNIEGMVRVAQQHPLVRDLLDMCEPETSIFWEDPRVGVCKVRPDLFPIEGRVVPDFKTTAAELTDDSLAKVILAYRLHQQADWYEEGARWAGIERPRWLPIFQEKTEPWQIRVVELSDTFRQWGRIENDEARRIYAECMEAGTWPSYPPEITTIEMPAWADKIRTEKAWAGQEDWQAPAEAAE